MVGRNGVGKTNLLESLHVATQGFSPRTRTDAQLIRFGAGASRIAVRGRRAATPLDIEIVLEAGSAKRARLNGAPLRTAEQLRGETATLVFTPDRLGVIKGAPAARRAYFDRVLGRLAPARAHLPAEYGAAVVLVISGGFYSAHDAIAPAFIRPLLDRGYTVFAVVHGSQPRYTVPEIDAPLTGTKASTLGATGAATAGVPSVFTAVSGAFTGPDAGADGLSSPHAMISEPPPRPSAAAAIIIHDAFDFAM